MKKSVSTSKPTALVSRASKGISRKKSTNQKTNDAGIVTARGSDSDVDSDVVAECGNCGLKSLGSTLVEVERYTNHGLMCGVLPLSQALEGLLSYTGTTRIQCTNCGYSVMINKDMINGKRLLSRPRLPAKAGDVPMQR